MKTSRKLKQLIIDEEKTVTKIMDLQKSLKDIREARKKEEDLEIVRTLRSRKLSPWELFDLLTGIQEGTVTIEKHINVPDDDSFPDSEETDGAGAIAGGRAPEQFRDPDTGGSSNGLQSSNDSQNAIPEETHSFISESQEGDQDTEDQQ